MMPEVYDVAIVGAGLGGLVCANILSGEGYNVVVLEKNKQLGGSLQVFSREKRVFDTGVHYVGALGEGQILNQYFKFLGIRDDLDLIQMDKDGFDRLRFGNEDKEYSYAQGMERFQDSMYQQFPKEKEAITQYCAKMKEVCGRFPLYNLERLDAAYEMNESLVLPAADYIDSLSNDRRFTQVLGGTNMLYAGERSKSPFYLHALIVNSYIQSAWKPVNGGSQIPTALARRIRENGGTIMKKAKVSNIEMSRTGGESYIDLENGERVHTKKVISNIHPMATFDLVGTDRFRKSYVNRLQRMDNTISSFSAYLVVKESEVPYNNFNIYHYDDDVWAGTNYTQENWPNAFFVSASAAKKHLPFTDAISVLCYMHYDEVKQWEKTHNTVANQGERGGTYEEFKEEKLKAVIKKLEGVVPQVKGKIENAYAATPLTYRDYIGSPDGSMYGTAKDYKSFLSTIIYPRTSVPNLYLTGQNLASHGVIGVTVSAVTTCFEFIEREKLLKKIIAS